MATTSLGRFASSSIAPVDPTEPTGLVPDEEAIASRSDGRHRQRDEPRHREVASFQQRETLRSANSENRVGRREHCQRPSL